MNSAWEPEATVQRLVKSVFETRQDQNPVWSTGVLMFCRLVLASISGGYISDVCARPVARAARGIGNPLFVEKCTPRFG